MAPATRGSIGPTAQLVFSLGKTVAQIMADFSPVPGLSPAVQLLILIVDTCEGVTYNR